LQFTAADTQSTYAFDLDITDTSSSAPGIKIGFAFPAGASFRGKVFGEDSTSKQWHSELITTTATATGAYQMQNATGGIIFIHGEVAIGSTAGNVIFEFLKNTSGTAGVLKYSRLSWKKVL